MLIGQNAHGIKTAPDIGPMVTTAAHAESLGAKPVARIIAQGSVAQEPEWFTTAPIAAIRLVLERAGMQVDDIDLFEVNEAFAVVPIVFEQDLGIDHAIVNVNGGGCSLGHPLGASGARIISTLNSVLHQQSGSIGVAGICNGGGGASAMVIEKL